MLEKEIMTRQETVAFVGKILALAMNGQEIPASLSPKKYIQSQDLEFALDKATQILAHQFDKIPDEFPGSFEMQETLRQSIDTLMSDVAVIIRNMLVKLHNPES